MSEEEREDEGVNRSSSMLACLKEIALISPICEKRAIALLFQAVKEQFLDKDLVKKVKRRNKFNWYLSYVIVVFKTLSSTSQIVSKIEIEPTKVLRKTPSQL